MRGADALIAMRRRGHVPEIVFLDSWQRLGRGSAVFTSYDDWHVEHPHRAHLMLDRAREPLRTDLRCVVGLTVCITESDESLARQMHAACVAAKAARVITHFVRQEGHPDYPKFPMEWCADTAGGLSWPA